jgi:hypothetical protein
MKDLPAAPVTTRPRGVTSVNYCLRKLANSTPRHGLEQLVRTDRVTTARLIAHMAEFMARKLYLEDGYASMYDYCVGALGMSEDVACGRIRAARVARRFPRIFEALADGRMQLTGIVLLAPHLTQENAEELLTAAFHKSKRKIQLLLAERFPQPDLPTFIESLAIQPMHSSVPARIDHPTEAVPQPADSSVPARMDLPTEAGPRPAQTSVPARMDVPTARVTPRAPERFAWQVTVSQETQELLRQVQDLLGHDVAPGDLEAVLNFALRAAKQKLERRKFAATEQPRAGQRHSNPDARYIPAEVRRAVWRRDGGQCTFVSETGHRCGERKDLNFDHIDPYARGGKATIGGLRLLCRAHNQYAAERTFGAEFMRHKRIAAAEARAQRKVRTASEALPASLPAP